MEEKLTKGMCKPRKVMMVGGRGEAWFYVGRRGLEVCVAAEKGAASSNNFLITKRQLRRALQIIEVPNGKR